MRRSSAIFLAALIAVLAVILRRALACPQLPPAARGTWREVGSDDV
ncbi:MAG: hypothetical protein ACYC55_04160 [Candidatus Geothermincolia bacterium]